MPLPRCLMPSRAPKDRQEYLDAEVELRNKVILLGQSGFDQQRTQLALENAAQRKALEDKEQMTEETWTLIEAIYQTGLQKINAAEAAQNEKEDETLRQKQAKEDSAYVLELQKLEQQMAKVAAVRTTGQQKLAADYQRDLQQYSAVEEAKALVTAKNENQMIVIMASYAAIRGQITDKYKADLQTLLNSQGWQGVFGSKFGEALKGNEALLKQWQTSTNQSLMLVQVSIEQLKVMGRQAFEQLAQGMGSGIAQAFVYSASVGQAMRAAETAVLESIAAQAATQAIYAAGWGFYDLATGNEPGATAAFEAAGIFAVVAGVAGAAGRAIAPPSAAAASAASGSTDTSSAAADSTTAAGSSGTGTQQPTVYITVQGHVIGPSGITELTDMINQAVYSNNVQLYASANSKGTSLG